MNSYLDLVTQYNKVHRKKNRVIVACIALAVCLVVAVFGMADIGVKFQIEQLKKDFGSFHVNFKDINEDQAAKISNRVDVEHSGWIQMANTIKFHEKEILITGGDEEATELLGVSVAEGKYPENSNEILVDRQALKEYGWLVGDTIKLNLDSKGNKEYNIVGIFNEFSALKSNDNHGIILSFKGVRAIAPDEQARFYVQFKNGVNINKAVAEIDNSSGIDESRISKNTYLLTAMGQGGSTSLATNMYSIAFVLFTLVLTAGCIMISNSFNMNVLERVKFFGLMRCLGASRKQVKKYVMREGLQLSLKGIPFGLIAGSIIIEAAVILLRVLNPSAFGEIRVFQISVIGIMAGIGVGFITVILASLTPARKASRISPMSAILGNINEKENLSNKRAVCAKGLPIDISMGTHHAVANKKAFLLMISSFGVSIALFLGFSVFLDFAYNASNAFRPSTADISIYDPELFELVPHQKLDEILKTNGIKHAYGRNIETLSASSNRGQQGNAFIISYEDLQFNWAKDNLLSGKINTGLLNDGRHVLVNKDSGLRVGDKIMFHTKNGDVTSIVGGVLSKIPFNTSDDIFGKAIVSEKLFARLTGKQDYSIIDIQLKKNATDNILDVLRKDLSGKIRVCDNRQKNEEGRNMFFTMAIFIYGFTGVIAIITLFNIINSMNISVASRRKHYGMMRAVGISVNQLKRMVLLEALTYSLFGCVIGCTFGTILHKIIYTKMVTNYFGITWTLPINMLIVIILSIIVITILSVIAPIKKIGKLDIVDVVNAQ